QQLFFASAFLIPWRGPERVGRGYGSICEHLHRMATAKLANLFVTRALVVIGDSKDQQFRNGNPVDMSRRLQACQDSPGLRPEEKSVGGDGIVEGLDPHGIARTDELPGARVPERERVHPVEAVETRRSPLPISFEKDFGVRPGMKRRFARKFLPKLN